LLAGQVYSYSFDGSSVYSLPRERTPGLLDAFSGCTEG
jgi:hypothetical protein